MKQKGFTLGKLTAGFLSLMLILSSFTTIVFAIDCAIKVYNECEECETHTFYDEKKKCEICDEYANKENKEHTTCEKCDENENIAECDEYKNCEECDEYAKCEECEEHTEIMKMYSGTGLADLMQAIANAQPGDFINISELAPGISEICLQGPIVVNNSERDNYDAAITIYATEPVTIFAAPNQRHFISEYRLTLSGNITLDGNGAGGGVYIANGAFNSGASFGLGGMEDGILHQGITFHNIIFPGNQANAVHSRGTIAFRRGTQITNSGTTMHAASNITVRRGGSHSGMTFDVPFGGTFIDENISNNPIYGTDMFNQYSMISRLNYRSVSASANPTMIYGGNFEGGLNKAGGNICDDNGYKCQTGCCDEKGNNGNDDNNDNTPVNPPTPPRSPSRSSTAIGFDNLREHILCIEYCECEECYVTCVPCKGENCVPCNDPYCVICNDPCRDPYSEPCRDPYCALCSGAYGDLCATQLEIAKPPVPLASDAAEVQFGRDIPQTGLDNQTRTLMMVLMLSLMLVAFYIRYSYKSNKIESELITF